MYYLSCLPRLKIFFANPNNTGALFSMIALLLLIGLKSKKTSIWVTALFGFVISSVLAIMTFSRGAVIALFAGCILVLFNYIVKLERAKKISFVVVLLLLGVFAFTGHKRMSPSYILNDKSIYDRLAVWQKAPKMIYDAPEGWGHGRAGEAYSQWYQNEANNDVYKILINAHLQNLVEFPWIGRIVYIFIWLYAIILCSTFLKKRETIVFASVVFAFAICAFFNSILDNVSLWLLPVGCFLYILYLRSKMGYWPKRTSIILAFCFSLFISFSLILVGKYTASSESYVKISEKIKKVGQGEAKIWLVVEETNKIDRLYGKTVRKYYKDGINSVTVAAIQSIDNLPADAKGLIVVFGSISEASENIFNKETIGIERKEKIKQIFSRFSTIIYFYPENYSNIVFDNILEKQKVFVFWPVSYDGDIRYWQESVQGRTNIQLITVKGSHELIPNWFDIVLEKYKAIKERQ